ncbi:Uncharacterised protein [Segatella copri]|nr:Uncharacterised protein [Segatella copri]
MNKVRIQYGERIILNDLDWTVMNGERWALSGQNPLRQSSRQRRKHLGHQETHRLRIA